MIFPRHGAAWRGLARLVKPITWTRTRQKSGHIFKAWLGWARPGLAWQGEAGRGYSSTGRRKTTRHIFKARRGRAGHGMARRG